MRPDKTTSPEKGETAPTAHPAATSRVAVSPRAPDFAPVEEMLVRLARAIRQFHTYPATSPLCIDAITACHEALGAIELRERLVSRVTPHDLIVDEVHVGAGTIIEQELTKRLFKLRVAALDIDRSATPRDLSRFCIDLVESEDVDRTKATFAERLAEHGVGTIVPGMAHRPAVLDVGAPSASARNLLEHERRRQESLRQPDAPINYLYPPDKGWVRVDPSQSLDAVSLLDLVVLVDDPAEVATMLLKLTDDDPVGPDARQAALERKFSDVSTLFSALDPRLAQVMFGRLARAVLKLEPERRKNLLQRTILPGLLDGRADGTVLRDFPDMDLAESLCLLLDLETAAPEVLAAALNRLDLGTDRREALVPLIDEQLRSHDAGRPRGDGADIERYARELIRVDAKARTDFSEFTAFDLAIDAQAEAAVTGVRDGIGSTDTPAAQLRCLWQLVRLEPNPTLVDAFLRRTHGLYVQLERAERWRDLAESIAGYRELGIELESTRPDVSATIAKALIFYCIPRRVLTIAELHERDAVGRDLAVALVKALGGAIVPGFIALLDTEAHQKARVLTPLLTELAPTMAPLLEAEMHSCSVAAARTVAKLLGHAGPGYESAVANFVGHPDAQVAREALRALARIGTPAAAGVVSRQIQEGTGARRAAAEEALWHFPPAQTAVQLRELLRSRDFVLQQPQVAARLMDRAAQTRAPGLQDVLGELETLRFRFWKPSLVRMALKARELRAR